MRKRIVITGMGCLSPLGLDVESTWQAALAGRSGAGRITHFDPSEYKTQIAAEVKGFEPRNHFDVREARHMDRFSHFAVVSARQAIRDSRLEITDENRGRIGAIIGTGIGG